MHDIFSVWSKTKQIVIVAITAAVYAGTLIPFKPIQIIPGLTELRPASVIPVLFGILFGPAAAWGSAIGNLIADFFGMLSPASVFGFIANFLFSYVAFLLWRSFVRRAVVMDWKQDRSVRGEFDYREPGLRLRRWFRRMGVQVCTV